MASKVPAPSQDIRQQGWPCHGNHVPSSEQGNQWGRWVNCGRCGIRLQYTATAGKGKHRTAGPQPHILKKAIEELQAGLRGGEHDGADHEGEDHRDSGSQAAGGRACEVQKYDGSPGQRLCDGDADGADMRRPPGDDPQGQGGSDTEARAERKERAKPVKPMGPASSTASVQHQLEEQAKVATEIIETKDAEIALAQDHILYLEERLAGLKRRCRARRAKARSLRMCRRTNGTTP